MKDIIFSKKFRKSQRKMVRQGKDMKKLYDVVFRIQTSTLQPRHHDHALKGKLMPARECHIRPDWLLIYHLNTERLLLIDTGSHGDLFGG